MTTAKGGQPSREQRRTKRVESLLERLADVDLDLAENALGIANDPEVSASVRVQAMSLVAQFKTQVAVRAAGEEDAARAAELAATRAAFKLLCHGFPDASSPERLAEMAAEMKQRADELIAERDRLRVLERENEALREKLERAELRPLAARIEKPDRDEIERKVLEGAETPSEPVESSTPEIPDAEELETPPPAPKEPLDPRLVLAMQLHGTLPKPPPPQ